MQGHRRVHKIVPNTVKKPGFRGTSQTGRGQHERDLQRLVMSNPPRPGAALTAPGLAVSQRNSEQVPPDLGIEDADDFFRGPVDLEKPPVFLCT